MVNWVVSAVARRVELWDDTLVVPPPLAARAAVFAFGDELLDVRLERECERNVWRTPGGRSFAAAYLLPRAEAALLAELQRYSGISCKTHSSTSHSSTSTPALATALPNDPASTARTCQHE